MIKLTTDTSDVLRIYTTLSSDVNFASSRIMTNSVHFTRIQHGLGSFINQTTAISSAHLSLSENSRDLSFGMLRNKEKR